jgi:hypothetical protein
MKGYANESGFNMSSKVIQGSLMVAMLLQASLNAQEGISAVGVGTVSVPIQRGVVVFELTSSAEGSADAHAKLEDKKRLVITELEKVGLEGLKIVASGVSLSVGAPET